MLATRWTAAFDDPNWWFEVKWDGYRAVLASDECYAELGWEDPWRDGAVPSILDPRVTGGFFVSANRRAQWRRCALPRSTSAGTDRVPPSKRAPRSVMARTFHSHAVRQLRHFWPSRHDGADPPQVLDSKLPIVAPLVRNLPGGYKHTPSKDIADAIEWAKVRRIAPHRWEQDAPSDRAPIPPDLFARLYAAYERQKQRQARVDFEDMLALTVELLESDADAARLVQSQKTWISVDEYQDTNPLQERLLELWIGDSRDLAVVGDPDGIFYNPASAAWLERAFGLGTRLHHAFPVGAQPETGERPDPEGQVLTDRHDGISIRDDEQVFVVSAGCARSELVVRIAEKRVLKRDERSAGSRRQVPLLCDACHVVEDGARIIRDRGECSGHRARFGTLFRNHEAGCERAARGEKRGGGEQENSRIETQDDLQIDEV